MTDVAVIRERALARLAANDWSGAPLEECHFGDTDKGTHAHGYLPLYERHLVRNYIQRLTEIGVYNGGSLRMWARWLPDADIVGYDIEPENYTGPGDQNHGRIHFIAADATATDPFVQSDVIIDDGSHHGDDQVATFQRFWPSLTSGGWYVIEDLASVWGEEFRAGGMIWGLLTQKLADALGAAQVAELHAYEQIVFVRKR